MRIKLFYKEGHTKIIDTARDYNRDKEGIDETCGSLDKYDTFVLVDSKTRTDILKYEILA